MHEIKKMTYAPGLHVLIRDEAWRVMRVDSINAAHDALTVRGLSELARDHEAIFSTEFDQVEVLDPRATTLVQDPSSKYVATRHCLESLLRRMPPVDEKLHVGHLAAMDLLNYQLEPAALALAQPRQRLLIADAVGLGKTLEAGVLLSELIVRGKAKRILVVTLKSLLAQFQKEMWSRFSIPLVRLDSLALQRIQTEIPTNHNPFQFFDKAIISIDTLKQPSWSQRLERARWDVIVIDEAHNVAERGGQSHSSRRNRVARHLAAQSDALIMLSATPHDGKAESFASLMHMLDPTAIANPHAYTQDEIKRLYLRRFKKDVLAELKEQIPKRKLYEFRATASPPEEVAYQELSQMRFDRIDSRGGGGAHLFKISIEKALLSSPCAAIATIKTRIKRYASRDNASDYKADLETLTSFLGTLETIGPEAFSKYGRLITALREDLKWRSNRPDDRLVIFTESIPTMHWLADHLRRDLGLDEVSLMTLSGQMSDIEQQHVVEEFGKKSSKLSVLVASDVASEGINLHYQCHRMVHFDIPWSLMVFQQRNGRIDRYGQSKAPQIVYLLTESANAEIDADRRILEILIQKDTQVQENIGDPSALTGTFSVEEQEEQTAQAIATKDVDAFADSFFDDLFADPDAPPPSSSEARFAALPSRRVEVVKNTQAPSLFPSDFAYLRSVLTAINEEGSRPISQVEEDAEKQRISFTIPDDLRRRFRQWPKELEFGKDRITLTADVHTMSRAIEDARRTESTWPTTHYLWRLHPVFDWVEDRIASTFPRHSAPIVKLNRGLEPGEQVILAGGLIPNLKSQPVLHRWWTVCFRQGSLAPHLETFEAFLSRTHFATSPPPNTGDIPPEQVRACQALLPQAVQVVHHEMQRERERFEQKMRPALDAQLEELRRLLHKKIAAQTELFGRASHLEREGQARQIQARFDEHQRWLEASYKTENTPFVQIIAAFL